jgi:sn-glycerol 3-phosphate transport system substrate-binding protein
MLSRAGTVLIALTLLVGATVSCGGDDKPEGAAPADVPACPVGAFEKSATPTKVTLWHSYVGSSQQALQKLADTYNASHPKVVIDVQSQGNAATELLQKYQRAVPTKALPGIMIGEDWTTQYLVDSKTIVPAEACARVDKDPRAEIPDLLPAVRAAYTADGLLQPGAFSVATQIVGINTDHYTAAGLDPKVFPKTLADLRRDAEVLKAKGITAAPIVMQTNPWNMEFWVTGDRQTMVNNNNGKDSRATKSTFDNPASREAYQWLADMVRDGLLLAVPAADGNINDYLAMATGKASIILQSSGAISTVAAVLEGNVTSADLTAAGVQLPPGFKVTINLDMDEWPGLKEAGQGQIGGSAWYITNTTTPEVQSAAWDFLKWINEIPNQVTWTLDGSFLPVRTGVLDDPTLKTAWETTLKGKWFASAFAGLQTLSPDFTGPFMGPYDDFRKSLQRSLDDVTNGTKTPQQAIKSVDSELNAALKKYDNSNF